MIRVSVAIMAHRKREHMVPELLEKLDAPAEVVWDRLESRWETGRRSMLTYNPHATHHLVVQDDAILCRDLVAGLSEAIEFVPDNPIALYLGNVRPNQPQVTSRLFRALREDRSWVVMPGPWWGVGVCVPTGLIEEMVAWCDEPAHRNILNYDLRLARFFAFKRIDCWYTLPSLVDHRQDHVSLVPGRVAAGRCAHHFLGAQESARDVDWSRVPERVGPLHMEPIIQEALLGSRRVKIIGPNGRRLAVSPKAFRLVYAQRGFKLAGVEKKLPAKASKGA